MRAHIDYPKSKRFLKHVCFSTKRIEARKEIVRGLQELKNSLREESQKEIELLSDNIHKTLLLPAPKKKRKSKIKDIEERLDIAHNAVKSSEKEKIKKQIEELEKTYSSLKGKYPAGKLRAIRAKINKMKKRL